MTKPTLDENGFIEKCNEELKKHPDYEEGMRFISAPKDSTGKNSSLSTSLESLMPQNV